MQVILSEIDCLDALNKYGVYPDEFYTDFEAFKNNMAFFNDAIVLVIFAGNCRFNKKITLEATKGLMKRAESKSDKGIKAVYVVSDMTIAGVKSYYKYEGNIDKVSIMHGWKEVMTDVNIWKKLSSQPKKSTVYLAKQDTANIEDALERYKNRGKSEDEYAHLIQVPNLKKLLAKS
jgi:hypothetical protein